MYLNQVWWAGKHIKHAGQGASRSRTENHYFRWCIQILRFLWPVAFTQTYQIYNDINGEKSKESPHLRSSSSMTSALSIINCCWLNVLTDHFTIKIYFSYIFWAVKLIWAEICSCLRSKMFDLEHVLLKMISVYNVRKKSLQLHSNFFCSRSLNHNWTKNLSGVGSLELSSTTIVADENISTWFSQKCSCIG